MKPDEKPEEIEAKITVLTRGLNSAEVELKTGWPFAMTWTNHFNNFKDDTLHLARKMEI